MINASLSGDKKWTKEGKGEWGKRRDVNEKAGPENGVEKVNNEETEEIAMEDWLRGIWEDVNWYQNLKKLLLIRQDNF